MKIHEEVLENGLRTFVAPRLGTEAATVLVFTRAGSLSESAEDSGIAHFIEHSVFKGTDQRPDAFSISKEFDGLGADFNAYTSLEYTGYVATVRRNNVAQAMSILSDMYQNATFPEGELEKEKGVVIEEIKMYQDDPQSAVYHNHYEQVFGDQPAGRSVAGTIETVTSFTRSRVAAMRDKWYTAANTVVIVTGAVDPAKVSDLLRENFGGLQQGDKLGLLKTPEMMTPVTKITERSSDQAHIVMSLEAPVVGSADREAAALLAKLLGGTMSSRLFQKLREELGLAYYVDAGLISHQNFGRFLIRAGTDVVRTQTAIQAIKDLIKEMFEGLITQEELDRVRESTLGHIALGLESSEAVAMFLAKEWLYFDSPSTPEERVKKIKAVALSHVMRIAKEIFSKEMHISVLGPASLKEQGII